MERGFIIEMVGEVSLDKKLFGGYGFSFCTLLNPYDQNLSLLFVTGFSHSDVGGKISSLINVSYRQSN